MAVFEATIGAGAGGETGPTSMRVEEDDEDVGGALTPPPPDKEALGDVTALFLISVFPVFGSLESGVGDVTPGDDDEGVVVVVVVTGVVGAV